MSRNEKNVAPNTTVTCPECSETFSGQKGSVCPSCKKEQNTRTTIMILIVTVVTILTFLLSCSDTSDVQNGLDDYFYNSGSSFSHTTDARR